MSLREEKEALRRICAAQREAMTPALKRRLDGKIESLAVSLWQYKHCGLVLSYASKQSEVGTGKLLKNALQSGKQVAVPYCVPGEDRMEFYHILSLEELVPGRFGVLEPDPAPSRLIRDFSDSICFVPGLCFDKLGRRIGYGMGFYDRFLACYEGYSIGLCYSAAVLRRVPSGRFDRRVDALITELGVRYIIE
mgnify:CR=1 FL=1